MNIPAKIQEFNKFSQYEGRERDNAELYQSFYIRIRSSLPERTKSARKISSSPKEDFEPVVQIGLTRLYII